MHEDLSMSCPVSKQCNSPAIAAALAPCPDKTMAPAGSLQLQVHFSHCL